MSITTTKGELRKLVREEYMRFLTEMDDAPTSAADQDLIDKAGREIATALMGAIAQHPHLPKDKLMAAAIEDCQALMARRSEK